jgi:transcriptional regulator with XRE-family HTH domain
MATPREQLAYALRQARIDAGYHTHGALARVLCVSRPVVTRAENASQSVPSEAILAAWANATGADLAMLTNYAERARSPRNWFARWSEDFEPRATLIRWFEPLLVPGLLQTESYARAVLSWKPDSAGTEANLKSRMERQSVLDRAELRVLLLGSVLTREVGNASVMAEQLDYLVTVGSRPSVMLQVVPDIPDIAGALEGGFAVATEGAADVAAYSASNIKGSVFTEPDLVARAVRVFDGLRMDALPWSQTRDLIQKAGEQWRTRS